MKNEKNLKLTEKQVLSRIRCNLGIKGCQDLVL
jgi:hypothetical protein